MNTKPLLAIGDIHNQVDKVDEWLKRFPDYDVIFTGDYFDDYHDNPEIARRTALWLKDSLSKPNRIHLIGNHDFPYMTNGKVYCPGFTPEKNEAVKGVLTENDWSKFKFYHRQYDFWFSHAGFTLYWFGNPVTGKLDVDKIDELIEQDLSQIYGKLTHGRLWAADRYRGGMHRKGGLLWNDWRNLDYIPGINQIVGHTPMNQIKRRSNTDDDPEDQAIHINIDCELKHCLIVANGGLTTIVNRN
jgi:hypothetical protein